MSSFVHYEASGIYGKVGRLRSSLSITAKHDAQFSLKRPVETGGFQGAIALALGIHEEGTRKAVIEGVMHLSINSM